MSIIEKLAAAGNLNPEERARVQRNVEEFMKAAEEYPDLLEEAMTKMAGFSDLWQRSKPMLGQAAVSAGATVGGALALTVAGDMYSDIKGSLRKAKNYKSMMAENPDLAKMPAKKVQGVFNTLNTLNPVYAADPLVSGSFVRNTIDMERVDVGGLKNLSEGYRAHQQAAGGTALMDNYKLLSGVMSDARGMKSQEELDAETLSRRAGASKNYEELKSQGISDPLAAYKGRRRR